MDGPYMFDLFVFLSYILQLMIVNKAKTAYKY